MKRIILIGSITFTVLALSMIGCANANYTEADKTEVAYSSTGSFEYNALKTLSYQEVPELVYKVEPRFLARITKENLLKAKSVQDIFPKKATKDIISFETSEVVSLDQNGRDDIKEFGKSQILNEAQLALIQTFDYSTNFFLRAYYERIDGYSGKPFKQHVIYYMTVIPEKEAEYAEGQEALITYLKKQSLAATGVIEFDKLGASRVNFTVTKEGKINNVKLGSTSEYPSVDNKLIDIITHMPGKWIPATNAKGEKIDQELVFFFGRDGC